MNAPALYIALPVLGEFASLAHLFTDLENQSYKIFYVFVCINQYESWWDKPDKKHYCEDNEKSLAYLRSIRKNNLFIIDRSSRGKGWPDKKGGVGWARKILMDRIAAASDEGIIISMDADTHYPENYLQEIVTYFKNNPDKTGLSVPYYHRLDNKGTDRQILRYEIYMRYYALNMLRIENPYNFTALGSAIALPLWAYRKIGGMTPVKSGEDFYLLQKLVKNGRIGQWADTTAFPSARLSDRVLFGTGPALIKGMQGNWSSYPLYPAHFFDLVKQTYDLFPKLYEKEIETPMTPFLKKQLRTEDLWEPLRKNYTDRTNFMKACISKVDGLRILQFLRSMYTSSGSAENEQILKEYLLNNFNQQLDNKMRSILDHLDFNQSPVQELDLIREFVYDQEMKLRKKMEIS